MTKVRCLACCDVPKIFKRATAVFLSRAVRLVTQIDILNSTYSTTRFAFTYAWWSAYGFSRHVKNNAAEAAEMELIDQEKVPFYRCWCCCWWDVGVSSFLRGKIV